jgi:hypothetical protein
MGALGRPTRDQVFLKNWDNLPQPIIAAPGHLEARPIGLYQTPNTDAAMGQNSQPVHYLGLNPEIAKAYTIVPTNQGQRGGIASRQVMMMDPRNSPSRSQFSEGYTIPIQEFGAQILWQTPSAQHTAGKVLTQPSTKLASPFTTSSPIPTRMPWDV